MRHLLQDRAVPVRNRAAEFGARRGRNLLDTLLREVEDSRLASGLSYPALGRAVGMSASQVGRILRRESVDVGVIRVSELLATVGLELGARAFPAGPAVRDAPSLALLKRFRARLASALVCRTEVPVMGLSASGTVDLRAWDLAIDGPAWTARLDAETRLGDVQAVQRRIALKQRDSNVACAILLLSDTRHNREAVSLARGPLEEQFPVPARIALRYLGRGTSPGGNALILL